MTVFRESADRRREGEAGGGVLWCRARRTTFAARFLAVVGRGVGMHRLLGTMGTSMKAQERAALLETLESRFEQNQHRHEVVVWADVAAKLERNPGALEALQAMEATGGEPDVIGRDKDTGRLVYCDCSPESPAGRRSICYDREALESRKEHKPKTSAVEMAATIGIDLLTEDQYRGLQTLGSFDTKTSSWIRTPADVRALGGALFCDRRYGKVFLYHNGAESYYAARGFRGRLLI